MLLACLSESSLARGRFRQSSSAQVNHQCNGRAIRLQLMNCSPAAARCRCQPLAPCAAFELCARSSTGTNLWVCPHLLCKVRSKYPQKNIALFWGIFGESSLKIIKCMIKEPERADYSNHHYHQHCACSSVTSTNICKIPLKSWAFTNKPC